MLNEFLVISLNEVVFSSKLLSHFLDDIFFQVVPYAIIFCLGVRSDEIKGRVLIVTLILSFFVFLSYSIFYYVSYGYFIYSYEFKYPPTLYFTSFAVLMILLLKEVVYKFYSMVDGGRLPAPIDFIAANSIWIYLWHIGFAEYFIRAKPELGFVFEYLIIYSLAISITYFQVRYVTFLRGKVSSETLRRNLKLIFTG